MTEMVIMGVMHNPVQNIIAMWPSRAALLEDARATEPSLQEIAVYRWARRGSIPSRYWSALAAGAKRRRIRVNLKSIAAAHASEAAE